MQNTATNERPTGVTILAVLAAIGGVFGLLGSFALLAGGAAVGGPLGGSAMIFGIVTLLLSIASLAFAYGAWTLKPWAWTLGIAIQAINILVAIVMVAMGADIGSQILGIVIPAIILYYLFTPGVKRAFGRA